MVGLDLIEYHEKLREKVDTLQILDISHCCSKQVYQEGETDRDSLNKIIGDITEISTNTTSVEMISTFQHKDTSAHTICPLSDNESWLTYKDPGDFTLLRHDGHHINIVKNEASDLSFIPYDGGFLVCNGDKKNILKVEMSGKTSVWMDTSPLEAESIGEALNGNVLISLCDERSGTRTDQSQRSVRMVTPSGDVIHSYEYSEDGITPVLTRPIHVTQNNNSDVCVVNTYDDTKGKWCGNMCVFYEDGGLKFVYSGHAWDDLCNILCVNAMDNTIHVVSSAGAFLKYLFTQDTCVPDPFSLALHRGVLWVGSQGGEVRVYR